MSQLNTHQVVLVAATDMAESWGAVNCPFVASWAEVRKWGTPATPPVNVSHFAKNALSAIHAGLAKHDPPQRCGFTELSPAMPEGNNRHTYYNNGVQWVFLRRMHEGDMAGFRQKYQSWKIRFSHMDSGEKDSIRTAEMARKAPWTPPPPAATATGTFVHWDQVQTTAQQKGEDSFINWKALEYGYEKAGGKSIGVQVNSPYYRIAPIVNGCRNVEAAFSNVFDTGKPYFRRAFDKTLSRFHKKGTSWLPVAYQILSGFGAMVGVMAGAAVIGFGAGAAVSYFFLPGLSTGEFAVSGASLAMALAGKLMEAQFATDMVREANAQGKALETAVQTAWSGNVDAGSNQIAEVVAAIVFVGIQALVMKLAEGVAMGGMAMFKNVRERLSRMPKYNTREMETLVEDEVAATHPAAKTPTHADGVGYEEMRAPAALRPHVEIKPLDVGRDFKPELDQLEKDFLRPLEDLGKVENWNVKPGFKELEKKLPLKEFLDVAEEYRKFYRETLGHIQAVNAGAQMFDVYLAKMRNHGPITPELCKKFFPSLTETEAKAAANILSKITHSIGEATRRHDVDAGAIRVGVGSKLTVGVGKGMRLPATSAERQMAIWEGDFMKANPGATRRQFVEDLYKQLATHPDKLQALLEGFRVDRSRILHNTSFYHHLPKTPEDWAELGVDVIAALSQSRCYRKNDPGKSPGTIKIGAAEGDTRTVSVYECAMLKIGRAVYLDLEGLMGEDFVRNPQAKLTHLI